MADAVEGPLSRMSEDAVIRSLCDRQAVILAALGSLSAGQEWVEVAHVMGTLRRAGHDVSSAGVAHALAGLADRGRCERRQQGASTLWRSLPRAAVRQHAGASAPDCSPASRRAALRTRR